MNKDDILALDASPSARRYDANGFLHVDSTPLTKEQVVGYFGIEIPNFQTLGLDPKKMYYGYRPADEIEKAAETVNGIPLLLEHEEESADKPTDRRVGSVGTSAAFDAPYLKNAISITDKRGIHAVETERARQLSASYRYDPDFTSGEFDGIAYDFVMRNLRFNHVALVPKGRAGSDIVVSDSDPKGLNMNEGETERKEVDAAEAIMKAAEVIKSLHKDEGGEVVDITSDMVMDMISKLSPEEAEKFKAASAPKAEDSEADKDDKKAEDEKSEEDKDKKEVAMDSAAIFKELHARDKVYAAASKFIGAFDHGGMSLAQVCEYAAKKLELDAPKGQEQAAVMAYLKGRTVPATVAFAHDAAPKGKSKGDELISKTYGG